MQVLQAGAHRLIYLELQTEMVASLARQAGFEARAKDSSRTIQLDLTAPARQAPLLLFDAADPGNLGWFSRCQFYVDGRSGAVMQTPITLANKRDRAGRMQRNSVRLAISKELPADFRLPGKQPLTEQVFYHLLVTFLQALTVNGVAVCGSGVGASVCANKIRGIRAALVHDHFSARQGVEDDHMNIICMGGRTIGPSAAWDLVEAFLAAEFSQAPRHLHRLAAVASLEHESSRSFAPATRSK